MIMPAQWISHKPVITGFLALAVLIGGFGTWATTSHIAGAIVSQARFEVDRNRQVVQHQTGGIVSEILVDEGDLVEAGDMLLQLDGSQLNSELAIVDAQLYELMARRGRFEAERDEADEIHFTPSLLQASLANTEIQEMVSGQSNLFHARKMSLRKEMEQMAKRIDQTASEIEGISAQKLSLAQQLELIEEELLNQQSLLAKQLTQAGTVLSLKREAARLRGRLGELAASKSRAAGQITEIEIEQIKIKTQRREQAISSLRDLRSLELELAERANALRHEIEQLSVRAPVSGVIYGMQVRTPRSVIRAAEPVLFLVPQDRPLVVAARINLIHVDQLVIGQKVTLRLSSLEQRITPELYGSIAQISADSFEDEKTGQSYYRTEILLNQGEFEKLREGTVLMPGMPVEAYIKTGARTPLAYLAKPLTDYFVKAFRET